MVILTLGCKFGAAKARGKLSTESVDNSVGELWRSWLFRAYHGRFQDCLFFRQISNALIYLAILCDEGKALINKRDFLTRHHAAVRKWTNRRNPADQGAFQAPTQGKLARSASRVCGPAGSPQVASSHAV
ncbi:hypothetical protein [Paracoccus jeotgali]|uniref:hypothetical protein n=1 Tax=Paracoccus jeotgali TaxID=2065379 RepID=UPI00131530B0|nr:hypothetical protein [Paracoccus jeotgali]